MAGETGVPTITLPPTDAPRAGSAGHGESWRLILLAMAALLAAGLILVPGKTAVGRRDR